MGLQIAPQIMRWYIACNHGCEHINKKFAGFLINFCDVITYFAGEIGGLSYPINEGWCLMKSRPETFNFWVVLQNFY